MDFSDTRKPFLISTQDLRKWAEALEDVVLISANYLAELEKVKKYNKELAYYKDMSLEQILETLQDYFLDFDLRDMLESLAFRKEYIELLVRYIKSINRVLKHLIKKACSNFEMNKRFFYRKIQNFLFKNLDDYHSTISFN